MSKEKQKVFITGHQNPDMDSVCAAWCYAKLKQQIDPDTEYMPIARGPLNEQTKRVSRIVILNRRRL
ncbi:MAG: DHH family phosphoesterase [Spirochaetia bacterium]